MLSKEERAKLVYILIMEDIPAHRAYYLSDDELIKAAKSISCFATQMEEV